jgi:charged multivesicular body protein 3
MSQILEMLVGKKLTPEEQVRKWKSSLRKEERELDKTVRKIDQEEVKTKKFIKDAAKRGDSKSCKMLASEIIKARKQKEKLMISKAQLSSLGMQMQQQLSVAKVTGVLQKSTETMKVVNKLMRLPEINNTMRDMSVEMMKAGVIEEMMEDALGGDNESVEEEAQEAVDQVLFELTDGNCFLIKDYWAKLEQLEWN